ncbi:Shikimate kinase I [Prochlorococcus sp. MIT 0602]|nr:Shikimate kinase I [Prochlorococcus sp. MIT 0602]KGG18198.1 Shikimate kinase I [Prochlorococcus sp. MIT 0603]
MGSGKSSTGPHLAKALEYKFVDQDKLIEEVAKLSIPEIFDQDGESGFRELEAQVLKEIGKRHSLVVATGGGVVLRSHNWGILHQGIVIWISPSRDRLIARLESDQTKRPLLTNRDPIAALDSLIKERQPFYAESDLYISVANETAEEVALDICNKLPAILTSPEELDV